jgi:glycosyltransferase involved in cell wall biosynthesis
VSTPVLSVTVTNYNYGQFLEQALTSIRTQTFENFEVVVVDNASTDNSLEIVHHHASQDGRIRVISHETNQGMLASLRESVDLCRGRYRVHVDADDFVLSDHAFASQVQILDRNPELAFVYSRLTMVEPAGETIYSSRPYPADVILSGGEALEKVLAFNLNHSGLMFRLDSYRSTSGYPDEWAHVADMALAARLCAVGHVAYLDRELYAFRKHGENLHLRPDRAVMRNEILPVIDEAFAGPLRATIPNFPRTRRRVLRNALVHLPTQYIFSDRPRMGWRMYWDSARIHPWLTIVQPRTGALVARFLLGKDLYERMRCVVGRDL